MYRRQTELGSKTKKQRLETVQIKMLRVHIGLTTLDQIRGKEIRKRQNVKIQSKKLKNSKVTHRKNVKR